MRTILLTTFALALWAAPASAQLTVIDPAAIAKQIEQIRQTVKMIEQGKEQIAEANERICGTMTVEGAPGLKPEHAKLMSDLNVDGNQPQGDRIVVDKSERVLQVWNGQRLVGQFPVTMGSGKDPLPLGNWKVTTFAYLPPFHYQPDLFWDVEDSKDDQMLPPGPNGPVGVAWLDLTKEHYGIHGTPEPHTIGRAESHGCIRMTNWDVLRVSRMIKAGTKAVFQA